VPAISGWPSGRPVQPIRLAITMLIDREKGFATAPDSTSPPRWSCEGRSIAHHGGTRPSTTSYTITSGRPTTGLSITGTKNAGRRVSGRRDHRPAYLIGADGNIGYQKHRRAQPSAISRQSRPGTAAEPSAPPTSSERPSRLPAIHHNLEGGRREEGIPIAVALGDETLAASSGERRPGRARTAVRPIAKRSSATAWSDVPSA